MGIPSASRRRSSLSFSNVASSRSNTSSTRWLGIAELGRREDALAAIEEAVTIRRSLAEARPDAFAPDLAGSLNNLSNHLAQLDRHEDALATIEEAVTIRRSLAEARPDAFRPDLALSLNNLSNRLAQLDRHEDAQAAIEEATAVHLAGNTP